MWWWIAFHAPPFLCVELQVQHPSWFNRDALLMCTYAGKELDLYSLRSVTYMLPPIIPFTAQNKTTPVDTKYLENIILLLLDINHLNTHQATSILG